jgi:hypothetical protein
MNLKNGTLAEVVPGSGLFNYPASTLNPIISTTADDYIAGPHMGYVVNYGYFGEVIHGSNSLTGAIAGGPQSGKYGTYSDFFEYNAMGSVNVRAHGLTAITSLLTQGSNYTIKTSFNSASTYSYAADVKSDDYRLGTSQTLYNRSSGDNSISTIDFFGGSGNTNIRNSNTFDWSHPLENYIEASRHEMPLIDRLNYNEMNGYPWLGSQFAIRELQASGEIPLRVWQDGRPENYRKTNFTDTIHTTPASVKIIGFPEYPQGEFANGPTNDTHVYYSYWPGGSAFENHLTVKRPAIYQNIDFSHKQYGVETESQPLLESELQDGDLLAEPGYYMTYNLNKNLNSTLPQVWTQTPVIDTAHENARVDGKRGKGKEWVMIER